MTNFDTSRRLLLVDDDVSFGDALARAMGRRGFEVTLARDTTSALDVLSEFAPEFALVDLRLGEESGLALVERLAKSNSAMRIVVLTGYASIATAVEAIKLGAVQYLTKPTAPDDIVRAFSHDRDLGDPCIALPSKPMSVRRLEWEHIQRVLQEHDGNISAAARTLNMHRRSLQRKLQKRPVQK